MWPGAATQTLSGTPRDICAGLVGRRPPPTPPATGSGPRHVPDTRSPPQANQTQRTGKEDGSAARPVLYCGSVWGCRAAQHSRRRPRSPGPAPRPTWPPPPQAGPHGGSPVAGASRREPRGRGRLHAGRAGGLSRAQWGCCRPDCPRPPAPRRP